MSTDSSAAFTGDYGLAACPVSITTNPAASGASTRLSRGGGTPGEPPQPLQGAPLLHSPARNIPEWDGYGKVNPAEGMTKLSFVPSKRKEAQRFLSLIR